MSDDDRIIAAKALSAAWFVLALAKNWGDGVTTQAIDEAARMARDVIRPKIEEMLK